MHLLGWTHPLPLFLSEAAKDGILKVLLILPKNGDNYEILVGTIVNPQGITLDFLKLSGE